MEPFLTVEVLALVDASKTDRAALPILADALEEAGYEERQATGWGDAERYPEKTVLAMLRRGESAELFARFLTTEERAALATVGMGELKGVCLNASHGFSLMSECYRVRAGNTEEARVSGFGYPMDAYPVAAFVAAQAERNRVKEARRQARTAHDLINDPETAAILDELIVTGRAYCTRTDAIARRPVVREAVAIRRAERAALSGSQV